MKKLLISILLIFLISILFLRNIEFFFPNLFTSYSEKFTKEKFEKIKVGMTKKEVDSILGKPFFFRENEVLDDTQNAKFEASYSKQKSDLFFIFEYWHFFFIQYDKNLLVVEKFSGTEYD